MIDIAADLRACLADWNDQAIISGQTISGVYSRRPVDTGIDEAIVSGFELTFACHAADVVSLAEGELIEVIGRGQFRVLRRFGPDAAELMELELGLLEDA